MTIVTLAVFDFQQTRYRSLLEMWLRLVQSHLPESNVVILTDGSISVQGAQTVVCRRDTERPVYWNVGFKLFNLCQLDFPHVYLDLDCAVLNSAPLLGELLFNSPLNYYAALQGAGPGFNSGVYVAPQGMRWVDYQAVRDIAVRKQFSVPGYDQAALWHWFCEAKVEWGRLPSSYNTEAGEVSLSFDGRWRGQDCHGSPIHISHYWGRKPWDSGCPMYRSFQKLGAQHSTSTVDGLQGKFLALGFGDMDWHAVHGR